MPIKNKVKLSWTAKRAIALPYLFYLLKAESKPRTLQYLRDSVNRYAAWPIKTKAMGETHGLTETEILRILQEPYFISSIHKSQKRVKGELQSNEVIVWSLTEQAKQIPFTPNSLGDILEKNSILD